MEAYMVENLFIMEQEFHGALKNSEFRVWYQPQIDMRTGKHCGAEALVRWQKQDGSLVKPDAFVPPLEKLGLIARLDEEVLENVCRDISQARKQGITLGPVSVNLSRLQAGRNVITEKLKKITEEYEITRDELFFEITETADGAEDGLPGLVVKDAAALTGPALPPPESLTRWTKLYSVPRSRPLNVGLSFQESSPSDTSPYS